MYPHAFLGPFTPFPAPLQARRFDRALALIVRQSWWDRAQALVRALSRERDAPLLAQCGAALAKAGQYAAAKEAMLKLGNPRGLTDLAVSAGRWEDAALLAVAHPDLGPRVHVPHAAWLAARDRCEQRAGMVAAVVPRTHLPCQIWAPCYSPPPHLCSKLQSGATPLPQV